MSTDQASKLLDVLAERFGTTGAALWSAYWHATQFFAAECLLIAVGFGVSCFLASRQIEIEDDYFQWVRPTMMLLSLGVVALGLAANLTDVVMPQGAALHSLVGK